MQFQSTSSSGAFLTAQWRYLLMFNYEVSPQLLEPFVPAGVVLDLFQGRALISVVGFRFLRTRLLRVPVPFHRDFDEVNLRFYIRREMHDGKIRRGVAFIRELVPRAAIALVARIAYNEPYLAVPMHSIAPVGMTDTPGRVEYHWRTAAGPQHVAATATGAPFIPSADSEASFITEHYWGYTRQRDGGTVEYQVQHPPWRVWEVTAPELVLDAAGLYGTDFERVLSGEPCSALLAEGSAITVFRPRRLISPGSTSIR